MLGVKSDKVSYSLSGISSRQTIANKTVTGINVFTRSGCLFQTQAARDVQYTHGAAQIDGFVRVPADGNQFLADDHSLARHQSLS